MYNEFMKKFHMITFSLLFVSLNVSCTLKNSHTGGITGFIRTTNSGDQRGLIVYLASPFSYEEEIGGFLDLSQAPFGHVQDNGYFRIENVPPGRYILVVYEVVMGGRALLDEKGKFVIIQIQPGSVSDLGIIDFNWEP